MLVAQEDNADSGTPPSPLSADEQRAVGAMKGSRAGKGLEIGKILALQISEPFVMERSDQAVVASSQPQVGKFTSPPN